MITESWIAISVIVPVHNNARDLSECVAALKASAVPGMEILIVDDASTDDTAQAAAAMDVRVFNLAKNSGPAAARNLGARQARGKILFFVDADVVIASGALHRVEKVFAERRDLSAVFGSYDAQPKASDVISQYRNLLHHFVHQNGNPEATTFWAGCGAIRRAAFEQVGGFDEKQFPRPSIEDIELGYRLRSAGCKIFLDKSLQGKHLKRWNFRSLVHTDIFRRAIPWSRLILESRNLPNDLNLTHGQRLSVLFVALAWVFLILAARYPYSLSVSAFALLALVLLNRKLYGFFFRQRGFLFATVSASLHIFYYFYSGASYFCVWLDFHSRRLVTISKYLRPKAHDPEP